MNDEKTLQQHICNVRTQIITNGRIHIAHECFEVCPFGTCLFHKGLERGYAIRNTHVDPNLLLEKMEIAV